MLRGRYLGIMAAIWRSTAVTDVSAFRTRHLQQLRKLAKHRGTSVSSVVEGFVTDGIVRNHRNDLRDILTRAMNAVGDLAWTNLDTPARDDVLRRLESALKEFEEALDKAGL